MSTTVNLHRTWFLTRFAWHMQDYPQRNYRGIRDDLRRELDGAATEIGMRSAVRALGRPAALARSYEDQLDRPTPRWGTGAAAAGLVVGLVVLLGTVYAIGALDALDAVGGGTATIHAFGGAAVYTAGEHGLSVETTIGLPATLTVGSLAIATMLLAARAWRALPVRPGRA